MKYSRSSNLKKAQARPQNNIQILPQLPLSGTDPASNLLAPLAAQSQPFPDKAAIDQSSAANAVGFNGSVRARVEPARVV